MTQAIVEIKTESPQFAFSEQQKVAIGSALQLRRLIITGGAGSGKTTVISAIIKGLLRQDPDENIVLTAPTGKAAARITEATGYHAITLHSACGFFPVEGSDELGMVPSENIPVMTATTVIVDEASMCDEALMSGFSSRTPRKCRVILVGDPNQLPPVGAGYPFRDLINSGMVPRVHLDVCHRQQGKLLENCYKVLAGDLDGLLVNPEDRTNNDWGMIPCSDEAIEESLKRLFTQGGCEKNFGIPCEELLVLTPLNTGPQGRVRLNRTIQRAYHVSRGRSAPVYKFEDTLPDDEVLEGVNNEPKKGKKKFERDQFVIGDKVIWTKNDAIQGLVNGDTGVVTGVGGDTVRVAWDNGMEKWIEPGINLNLGWVLTCHKAQGSQYTKVLVVCSGRHATDRLSKIINRQWIYTAATRSKKGSFFLGSERAFEKHVNTASMDNRQTYLSELLSKHAVNDREKLASSPWDE